MASIFAMENEQRMKRLILLAPAINLMEFSPYRERNCNYRCTSITAGRMT